MKSEKDIHKVDVVDKVGIGRFIVFNTLLYIDIVMSTLYKYMYFNRWT